MGDSKYGRLFTEDDVVRIARGVAHIYSGRDDITEDGVRESLGGVLDHFDDKLSDQPDRPLRFPADEPLFLLRGKDLCAPQAIAHYATACEYRSASAEHVAAAREAGLAMNGWQHEQIRAEHAVAHVDPRPRGRIKVPD